MTLPLSQPNYFDSSEVGAPTLNNVVGSRLEVLRACLINGFNPKAVTSIEVASGVATATAAAHGYTATYGKLLLIEGATDALLNGRKQPLSVATNTFTYAAPGVADGTYTGTMSAKRAPLGWTEPYSGTNVAMFARGAAEASAQMLRVNDSHAAGSTVTDSRAIMVESATGIDAYTAPAPTEAQVSGGYYWSKGANTATAKEWVIVGTDAGVYMCWPLTTASVYHFTYFVDLVSFYPADAYKGVLCGNAGATTGGNTSTRSFSFQNLTNLNFQNINPVVARARSGTGGAVYLATIGATSTEGGSNGSTNFDYVPISWPVLLPEQDAGASNPIRGYLPGLAVPMANKPFTNREVVLAGGKRYLSIRTYNGGQLGNALISIENDWVA